jgi:hypothetical protein
MKIKVVGVEEVADENEIEKVYRCQVINILFHFATLD